MNKSGVDISVIVPIYNVEEYLEECLDSLLCQGNVSLEVIMLDDGSTDGSAAIAKKYAEKYPNYHYYGIENGGLGHARNYAVQFATGKYIIFLDSDDIVVEKTYEKMFLLAEKNNSELTICNVARFNSKKSWASALHKNVFHNIDVNTHITKNPNLIYDTTSWNKLILKSFYTEHDFQFPENILYEDIPVTIPMHILANNVSVLTDIGYLWRLRDGASKSITQRVSNMDNLIDRIKIMEMLDTFFEKNVTDVGLHKAKQRKALEVDLMIFVNICKSIPEDQALEMIGLIKEYIHKAVPQEAFQKLTVLNKQKYEYVMAENVDALVKICEYGSKKYGLAPVIEENGRLMAELPDDLFTISDRDVTEEINNQGPRYYVDDVKMKDRQVEISGHVYRQRINIKDFEEQKVSVFLYNQLTENKISLKVIPEPQTELTETRGLVVDKEAGIQTQYNYDGTGFTAILDLNEIENYRENIGWNKILVEYENRFTKGKIFLGGCAGALKRKHHLSTWFSGNTIARFKFDYLNEVSILIRDVQYYMEDFTIEGDKVLCKSTQHIDSLWCVNQETEEKLPFDTKNHRDFYLDIENLKTGKRYDVQAETDAQVEELLSKEKGVQIKGNNKHMAIVNTARTYSLKIWLYNQGTEVEETERKGRIVRFKTRTKGDAALLECVKRASLCVEDKISGGTVILDETACTFEDGCVECDFRVDFSDKKINKNFYQSIRDVYVVYKLENGEVVKNILYGTSAFKHMISFQTLQIGCYRGVDGTVRLRFTQQWEKEEDSASKRDSLILKNYPLYRKEKINPRQIVFESMWGAKYSCNPQALYEYIDKNHPEYECIWSLNDVRTPIKGKGKRVRRGSLEYYHYLATAKYLVNNVNFPNDYEKRDGQIEIQTMHGTPLKTLGLDVEADFPTASSRKLYIEKNSRWNYLIVQGEFMAQKGKSCFEFQKETLCTGYPRTDCLFENNPDKIAILKKELGLPLDKKIILYAPTWRIKNRFDMELDLEKMRVALSDEYIILVRLHHFASSGYEIPEDKEFIWDFNSYRCVEELYQVSDILITDYSSVMFDYALLNKPMLFYTYDLEEYGEKLRGLYVDFEKEAPGPLLFNTDDVIYTIKNLDEEMSKCEEKIQDFKQKFLTYENPDSCRKIVERVLEHSTFQQYLHKFKRIFNGKEK